MLLFKEAQSFARNREQAYTLPYVLYSESELAWIEWRATDIVERTGCAWTIARSEACTQLARARTQPGCKVLIFRSPGTSHASTITKKRARVGSDMTTVTLDGLIYRMNHKLAGNMQKLYPDPDDKGTYYIDNRMTRKRVQSGITVADLEKLARSNGALKDHETFDDRS